MHSGNKNKLKQLGAIDFVEGSLYNAHKQGALNALNA